MIRCPECGHEPLYWSLNFDGQGCSSCQLFIPGERIRYLESCGLRRQSAVDQAYSDALLEPNQRVEMTDTGREVIVR